MEKTIRVTFIHAPERTYAELQNNGVIFMPVWAYTLASHIPEQAGYEINLFDMRLAGLESVQEADVFLFSGINQDYTNLCAVHDTLKERFPQARFFIGGPICWSFDQAGDLEKIDRWDHIVIGDGEETIGLALAAVRERRPLEHVIRVAQRFEISKAKELYWPLVERSFKNYYGAVLEVSRGCPFLCEFCDIRVLPDNNRPHNKPAAIILAEIDHLARLGVGRFLLACDNFIGDPRWAEEVADGIIAWQERTGFKPVFYTWLTINLHRMPVLMRKLRRANFDAVFIGIESFNSNSLLETAKVQNTTVELVKAIRQIQSFGFPVIAGLIFGFDSDTPESFNMTLEGIAEAGLLSGDPSLLTALPGTPLHKRMRLAGRLRDVRYGLGGYKYQTNIQYLMSRDVIIKNYRKFVKTFISGKFQYRRLMSFMKNLHTENYIPIAGGGYINYGAAFKIILKNRAALLQILRRAAYFSATPSNYYWVLRAFFLVLGQKDVERRFEYFRVWLALWTNIILRYKNISENDFDIDGVASDFDKNRILPIEYMEAGNDIGDQHKMGAQREFTSRALTMLVEKRSKDEREAMSKVQLKQ